MSDTSNVSFLQLCDEIRDNKTLFVGRLSGNETALTGMVLDDIRPHANLLINMLHVAGIYFINEDSIKKYVKMYCNAVKNSDYLGIWTGSMQSQAHHFYKRLNSSTDFSNVKQIPARYLEPLYFMDDDKYMFNEALKDKTVLVISSHIDSMKRQVENKNIHKVFKKPIFDKCKELKYIRPPQTHCGRHNNVDWSVHFDNFCKELSKDTDYDIAFVSCGGYGMITCNYIVKELGKSVVYVGGGLQLFFGIMGDRWHNRDWYNEHWVSTLDHEVPDNKHLAEGGCYW